MYQSELIRITGNRGGVRMLLKRYVPFGIVRVVYCVVVMAMVFVSVNSAAGPLSPNQPYRFVVDQDQVDVFKFSATEVGVHFSGDFIVVPQTYGPIVDGRITNGNTRYKVFSSKTGKLVNTVRFEDLEDTEYGTRNELLDAYGEIGAFGFIKETATTAS